MDFFFTVPTATSRLLYVFVLLRHQRRRVVHVNITTAPTAARVAQQLRQAFPFETAPRYLIRDRDGIYGEEVRRCLASLNVEKPESPFPGLREQLRHYLSRADCEAKVQEEFRQSGDRDTVEALAGYIERCADVIHLVGELPGAVANKKAVAAYLGKEPTLDFLSQLLRGTPLALALPPWPTARGQLCRSTARAILTGASKANNKFGGGRPCITARRVRGSGGLMRWS
jgi:hypothetical protein